MSRADLERHLEGFNFHVKSDIDLYEKQLKQGFRQWLLNHFPDPDILLNKERMPERFALAQANKLPTQVMMDISNTYIGIAEKVIGEKLHISENPKQEIINILRNEYQLIAD
ncbi:MAG: phosphoribosylaminoimidazolesuccinocarboxamide synthase [Shewanella sp.]|nr:phosphoribosylaminoimidazolesuccinocarboxamide synthase [Shewanella sp.]